MKITSRPEIPCDACVARLLSEIPGDTPESAGFQIFSFCDHRRVMFSFQQSVYGQQWSTYSPATVEQLEQHVEMQRMVNRAQKDWLAANMPPPKLQ